MEEAGEQQRECRELNDPRLDVNTHEVPSAVSAEAVNAPDDKYNSRDHASDREKPVNQHELVGQSCDGEDVWSGRQNTERDQ